MIKKISPFITKTTGLSDAEIGQASIFQLILFLLITTLLLLKPTISSVFISALGSESLPIGYLATAVFAFLGSYLYQNAVDRMQLRDLVSSSLLITVGIILGFGVLLNIVSPNPLILYALYVFVAIYGLLTTSQFWLVANSLYSVRQAKRAFGFIGAGGIIGGIVGGYLTSLLTKIMPVQDVLFVAAGLLLVCVFLYKRLWKAGPSKQTKTLTPKSKESNPMELLKQSKLLNYIAIMTGLGVFAAKMVDYQYSDFAHKMTSSPEELSSFFGVWLSNISLISLLIQLFLTKEVLKRLGVSNTLFIMPSGLLLGSVLLVLVPELWVAIFIKLVDGSLKQSTNKSAREMVFMPIPADLRRRTKSFIDVVIDSVATGLAGFVLYIVINNLNLSTVSISIVTIVFILSWIYYIIKVKGAYKDSYKDLAGLNDWSEEDVPQDLSEELVSNVFQTNNTDSIIDLIHRIEKEERTDLVKYTIPLLDSENQKVVTETCKLLAYDKNDWTEQLQPLSESQDLRTATYAAKGILNHKDPEERKTILNSYLSSPVDFNYLVALRILADEVGFDRENQRRFNLPDLLEKTNNFYSSDVESPLRSDALDTILTVSRIANLNSYDHYIEENLLDPMDNRVLESAILASPITKKVKLIDVLLDYVKNPKLRTISLASIRDFGETGLNYIMEQWEGSSPVYEENLILPSVISSFGTKKAVKSLCRLSQDSSFSMATEIVQELNKLKKDYKIKIPNDFIDHNLKRLFRLYKENIASLYCIDKAIDKDISPTYQDAIDELKNVLLQIKNRPKQFLPSLLKLAYDESEIRGIEEVFRNGDKSKISNVIEYLDEIFDMTKRVYVEPLLLTETCENSNQIECEFDIMDVNQINLKQMIETLLKRNNPELRHALLNLVQQSGNKEFYPLIEPYTRSNDKSIQSHANEVVKVLS